jgi:Tfp pilus assembly protein PilN
MKRFNLLPPEQRVKASRERGLLYAIVLLVAVVAVLGLVYMQQKGTVNDKQGELDQLTAQTAVVQQQIVALQPYAQIQTTRTAMTQTARSIYDAGVQWSTIFQEISLVIPENVRLVTLNCTVPPAMLPGAATTPGTAPAGTADVTFSGVTYAHRDVAEFMTRLGLIPQLTNIQLSSSAGAASSTGTTATATTTASTVAFSVTASLRPYLTAPPVATLQPGVSQ